jgi:hypothetical protein
MGLGRRAGKVADLVAVSAVLVVGHMILDIVVG